MEGEAGARSRKVEDGGGFEDGGVTVRAAGDPEVAFALIGGGWQVDG